MVIFPIFFCSVFNIFMATEGKAIIFYRSNFFFVSIDERSAMGSQPNLASRSKVMSIYKCSPPPKKKSGAPPNLGRKITSIFGPLFPRLPLDTAYLRNETSKRQTKMLLSIYTMFPESLPTFRDV